MAPKECNYLFAGVNVPASFTDDPFWQVLPASRPRMAATFDSVHDYLRIARALGEILNANTG
jgi:hypothetical protein